jgi:L-ribulose-5-phosphate 3-epimerase
MMPTRRECLIGAGAAAVGLAVGVRAESVAPPRSKVKVGMFDQSMRRLDPTAFELASTIGLDGVEVSIGTVENNLWLRRLEMQEKYERAARASGLAIPSVAMGLLNRVPLMSEPRAALWVADTIPVAARLEAKCILLAFFGEGELKAENPEDMRRVTEVLKELAPRAEKAGVVLGIESYLCAEDHLKIIDAVGSKSVQVYYDVFNSGVTAGYDAIKELRLLGRERICQIHFKEGRARLGESGQIDWPAVAATLQEIGYDGWIVLETSSPQDVVVDTRANLAYVRQLFDGRS